MRRDLLECADCRGAEEVRKREGTAPEVMKVSVRRGCIHNGSKFFSASFKRVLSAAHEEPRINVSNVHHVKETTPPFCRKGSYKYNGAVRTEFSKL